MSKLFEKVKVGNLELKNHLVLCPMGFVKDIDGGISERQRNYLVERAKGGFGLIYPSTHFISNRFEPSQANTLEGWVHGSRLALAVEQVHQYGAKFAVQLSLGLGRVSLVDPFTPPKSASTCTSFWFPNLVCDPYTKEEIAWLVERFGYSASIAKNAGADVVEIHAYGGYLIDQFISSIWNHREDEYGGSLENRLRIVFELRQSVWDQCGKDFPVAVKVTPDHGFEGGRTLEEGIEMVKMLDDGGFTYIHLDKGAYECWYNSVTTAYQPEGSQLYMAEAVKKAGVKTPLMVQGKLDDPKVAESVLDNGLAELVGLGHATLADPYWALKVKTGREDDIIPCIGCNECLYHEIITSFSTCAVNPRTGAEIDYPLLPATEDLKILVIGGGPGGMEAAITAADRGFGVELWEKEAVLGGNLLAAGAPPFKFNTMRYLEYLRRQVAKRDIKVKLDTIATIENIKAEAPDVVILATGAEPICPMVDNIGCDTVFQALDFLIRKPEIGSDVAVIGAGLVGCEVAIMLEREGKNVTLIEMLDDILVTAQHAANNDAWLRHTIADSSINVMTGTKLISVSDNAITLECNEEQQEVACNNVILAVGFKPDNSLLTALQAENIKVFPIGDQKGGGKIIDAVHQGFHTVRLLEDLIKIY
ncbi:MAG: FAD-dependent oxidoreductase [Saccharofermentanales bacterium]